MLEWLGEDVGMSDGVSAVAREAPPHWPARGPPEWVGSVGGLDDEQRAPDDVADPATDLE